MDIETALKLSKHLIRLATETLTTIQGDQELTLMCEQGADMNLSHNDVKHLAKRAHSMSIFGSCANETARHRAAAAINHALQVRMYAMAGDTHEAGIHLWGYLNAYAIVQSMEGGEHYDANTPEGRAARESVKNVLIARCPAFAAEFID